MTVIQKVKKAASNAKKAVESGIKAAKRIAREVKQERAQRQQATRKKSNATISKKKAAVAAKKKAPIAAKKPAVAKRATSVKGKKAATKNTAKRRKPMLPPVELTHGVDMHLIPVKGEIHPAGKQDSKQYEKLFRTHEEVVLNQENMKAKAALATRKNIKTNFRNLRQP